MKHDQFTWIMVILGILLFAYILLIGVNYFFISVIFFLFLYLTIITNIKSRKLPPVIMNKQLFQSLHSFSITLLGSGFVILFLDLENMIFNKILILIILIASFLLTISEYQLVLIESKTNKK